ncbi:Uncharacterised protein [Actinomyces slackii]|uniref:Uncharacterized protein n=1 Tax=Actinomyces slackii TaxID=52774 RepID=A0A3S5EM61_9ACTO|nr:Uncharacterised protein [Actinomyces slackii]
MSAGRAARSPTSRPNRAAPHHSAQKRNSPGESTRASSSLSRRGRRVGGMPPLDAAPADMGDRDPGLGRGAPACRPVMLAPPSDGRPERRFAPTTWVCVPDEGSRRRRAPAYRTRVCVSDEGSRHRTGVSTGVIDAKVRRRRKGSSEPPRRRPTDRTRDRAARHTRRPGVAPPIALGIVRHGTPAAPASPPPIALGIMRHGTPAAPASPPPIALRIMRHGTPAAPCPGPRPALA